MRVLSNDFNCFFPVIDAVIDCSVYESGIVLLSQRGANDCRAFDASVCLCLAFDSNLTESRQQIHRQPVLKSTSSRNDAIQHLSAKLPRTLSSVLTSKSSGELWSKESAQHSTAFSHGAKLVKRKYSGSGHEHARQSTPAKAIKSTSVPTDAFSNDLRKKTTEKQQSLQNEKNNEPSCSEPRTTKFFSIVSKRAVSASQADEPGDQTRIASSNDLNKNRISSSSLVAYLSDTSSDTSD